MTYNVFAGMLNLAQLQLMVLKMVMMMMLTLFQLPSRDKFNCVSIRRFRVYKKRHLASGGHRYVLQKTVYVSQTDIRVVNQYKNFTIGVSLINNADLESDKTDYTFVGSQYMLCGH